MKIVFFGTPVFVEPVIKVLDEKFDLVAVIKKPADFNNEFLKELVQLQADLFVVAAYGKIIPEQVLDIPRLDSINIHPSLLPKYRGPSPIQSAILAGDKKTGVTFIKMDEKVDHGPIIYQIEDDIKPDDTFESLANRLFSKAAEKIEDVIKGYEKAKYAELQDENQVTFTKLYKKEDGFIDLKSPPKNLEKMIRAYHPWPGVWTKFELTGKEVIIKLLPGDKIQVEGKKPMTYKDFINGYEKGEEFLNMLDLDKS